MKSRKLIFDEDANALVQRSPPGRVKEHVEQWFDYLFTNGVDVLSYDCASPDVVPLLHCPHGEVFGERFKHFDRIPDWAFRTNLEELFEHGTDVLQIAAERARAHGKQILAQMRMSDAHHYHGRHDNPLFPQFVLDHPEWCIELEDGTLDIVLDYSVPEVRERRLAILRDIATNYDIDGVNLNWMRWCRHFAKAEQRTKAPILTEFIADVRAILDETAAARGCDRLELAHYVAAELDESLDIGCDVKAWVDRGLADFLMPMDFLFADYNIRTEQFAAATEGSGCGVYPAIQQAMIFDSDLAGRKSTFLMTEEKYRAVIKNLYSWGADGIACFNFCCWGFDPRFTETMLNALRIAASPEETDRGRRVYHYVPIWKDHDNGVCPTGRKRAQIIQFRRDEIGRRLPFRFRMADGRNGETLKGEMIIRIERASPQDGFAIDLNGTAVPPDSIRADDISAPHAHGFAPYPPGSTLRVRLEDCPPFAGDNELGMRWTKRTQRLTTTPRMSVLEIHVEA